MTSHILLLMCFQHLCVASGRPKLLISDTVAEVTGYHLQWLGDIKLSSAPYVNVSPVSTDFAGK